MMSRQVAALFVLVLLVGFFGIALDRADGAADAAVRLTDKTIVVWVSPATLEQQGGSALTVNDTTIDRFDGVVLGELEPAVWMPGSNGYSRTQKEQADWPKETVGPDQFVQMAITYKGKQVTVYRNGKVYASYAMGEEPYTYGPQTAILFGPRHRDNKDYFVGRIRDARVYAEVLSQDTIAAMEPGKAVEGAEAWAWWDFASTGTYERSGRFNAVELSGDARLAQGCLVLSGNEPALVATMSRSEASAEAAIPTTWSKSDEAVPAAVVASTRMFRERLLEDRYRPGYHFCVPEGNGRPGDANGCFYANGRYHLMYLYNRADVGFCWGHLSSSDLVHWRHHPDALGPGSGDEGAFSGGGFVDDDGTAYLSYWMLWGAKGIGITKSDDGHYSHWQKLDANPVIKSTEWGVTEIEGAGGEKVIYGSADPSNIWKQDGKYYMLTGNLLVLNKYGRAADAPKEMQGDRLYLFESTDMERWQYKGVFYERKPEWTDASEDNMCPSFLPLPSSPDGGGASGKHLLLFIAHNRGCQYYVGDYAPAAGRFAPNSHGRMSWVDNTYFAPEALVDGQGRQIMWAWLLDNPGGEEAKGWSGVFGLPRSLWVGPDGLLRMRPVKELAMLRCGEQRWPDVVLSDGQTKKLDGVVGDSCELEIKIAGDCQAQQYGVKVRVSAGGEEETLLYYDADAKELVFDATKSGVDGRRVVERAPLTLREGEALTLRVFVDKAVVEVYANDRQAIGRRVYPGRDDSVGVALFSKGGQARFTSVNAWEMMPSNPY